MSADEKADPRWNLTKRERRALLGFLLFLSLLVLALLVAG